MNGAQSGVLSCSGELDLTRARNEECFEEGQWHQYEQGSQCRIRRTCSKEWGAYAVKLQIRMGANCLGANGKVQLQ